MVDLNNFKTPIFEGINDVPREATDTEASNGSDLIHKVNGLCDSVSFALTQTEKTYDYSINFDLTDEETNNLEGDNNYNSFASFLESLQETGLEQDIEVKIIGTSSGTDALNFANINLKLGATVTLIGELDASFIVYGDEFTSNFIRNVTTSINIVFKQINFLHQNLVPYQDLSKVHFINCRITKEGDFDRDLMSFRDIQDVKIIDTSFSALTLSSFGGLFAANDVDKILFKNVNVACNARPFLGFTKSNGYFSDLFTVDDAGVSREGKLIRIVSSAVNLDFSSNLNVDNFDVVNSNIFVQKTANNFRKSYHFFFRELSDETIPLILIGKKSYRVDTIDFAETGVSSKLSLYKRTTPIPVASSSSYFTRYDLDSPDNFFQMNSFAPLNLKVTGTVNNVTIQINCYEY